MSCLLISFGTMYAVAAVLYDQLYAVAFNQSQLLLLSPPRSVGFSDWSVAILVLSCHYALAVLFQHTIVVSGFFSGGHAVLMIMTN